MSRPRDVLRREAHNESPATSMETKDGEELTLNRMAFPLVPYSPSASPFLLQDQGMRIIE